MRATLDGRYLANSLSIALIVCFGIHVILLKPLDWHLYVGSSEKAGVEVGARVAAEAKSGRFKNIMTSTRSR